MPHGVSIYTMMVPLNLVSRLQCCWHAGCWYRSSEESSQAVGDIRPDVTLG
jgi:hypothetical protein